MTLTPRGLDHVVHAVRDLDAAADLYRRCGFTVGARNRHPWGTHNHIVQLPGFFIELLTVAEPDKLGEDGFSRLFGRYNRDFLAAQGDGLSLLILESSDANTDAEAFAQAGIAGSDVLKFERDGQRPDGTPVKLAFSLAFAQDTSSRSLHFATCQQHYPDSFWNPAFQQHANGVESVAGVAIAAGKPLDHRFFLASFSGQSDIKREQNALIAQTPRGEITIMDPVEFRSRFGVAAPPTAAGPRLGAVRFTAQDLGKTAALLTSANIAFSESAGQIVIGAGIAMGATLVFEEAGQGNRSTR